MDGWMSGALRATGAISGMDCMRHLSLIIVALSGLLTSAIADEPVLEFLEGLRERGYYDTAIEYLDAQTARSDLKPEIREVLDLERGMTLQQMGAASRDPEQRVEILNTAETALKKFLAEHGQHPLAAQANSTLGELLFDRARSLIWKATDSDDVSARQAIQAEARTLVDQAKGIYQAAHDQYKAQFDAFPKFIDEATDEEQHQLRKAAESKYLRAWFNLVRCTYERGQTFDQGSEERRTTLKQAADLFEEIHTKRRTNVIGQHARLMMGKCYQEQNDFASALGIYQDLLGNKSEDSNAKMLQGIAQHYRLICFNDPEKANYELVVQEATVWLQANKQSSTKPWGIGILWEQAVAEEKLAEGRELPEEEKSRLLQSALSHAEQVARYPGAFREPAVAMSRRLKVVLGEKDREPRDFETAFERAHGMITQIQTLTTEMERAADPTERTQKKAALDNHLEHVGRLLQLALDLRDSESNPKAVAQARYLLSFVMMKRGDPLDAVVMASHCMVHDQKADQETALNATEIAMEAAVAAWNQAGGTNREFETRLLRDVCIQILKLYPQSSRAGEARMRVGNAYRTMEQPLEGARWFLEIPESDPQYANARINAGQSYWAAWTQRAAIAAAERDESQLASDDMKKWKAEARSLLNQGIQLTRTKLGEAAAPTEELIAAEVSLASIMNLDGEFAAAIERLTSHGENSVLKAIDVADPATRPESGIQSRTFAGLTYRILLRAYVGTQQIDQAIQAMSSLEKVGGGDLLDAYTQLGMELQEELRRLKQSGEADRLAATRTSFEQFLQKVYESRDKSDYNSLLWIGETYYGLGQGVSDDVAASETYFVRAGDAYSEILTGGLAAAENRNAVSLRLARCRRQQKSFDESLKLTSEILAQNAMMIDAQFEAALTLSAWGEKEPDRFTQAIVGPRDASGNPTAVWGWLTLSKRLQQLILRDPTSDMKPRYFEARYELANTRRQMAKTGSKEDQVKQLKAALAEISSLVQVFRDMDEVTFTRFDRLYQDVQADLGQTPHPLSRVAVKTETESESSETETADPTGTQLPVAASPTESSKETPQSNWLLTTIGIGLGLVVVGGIVFTLLKPRQRVRVPGTASAPRLNIPIEATNTNVMPEGLTFDSAPTEPDFSGFAGVSGKSSVSSRGARPATRPAAADAAGSASGAPAKKSAPEPGARPRPKPPVDGASAEPSKGANRPAVRPEEPGTRPPASRPPGTRPPGPRPSTGPTDQSGTRPPVRKPKPPETPQSDS